MNDHLLEPLKFYEKNGRKSHEENAKQFFEDLLARSGVDAEKNRATAKAYRDELARADAVSQRISNYKGLRVLLILGIVVGAILVGVSFSQVVSSSIGFMLGLLLGGIALVVGGILLIVKKINPIIKTATEQKEAHDKKAKALWDEAMAQMAPLNALFGEWDAVSLIEKTLPEVAFDRQFTKKNETFFIQAHDFLDRQTEESSMTDTLSGRFREDPFLFCRRLVHKLGTKTYHGSRTISWTETYRDSKGHLRTRRRTQTLHASVNKPCPYYHDETYLCYGSQAAPDLTFSRDPQHSERLSEKELERKIRKGEKRLQDMAEEALKDGRHFQEMANSEFEVLFDATNRDNEMQFRLMYTPLGQCNTVDLLTSDTGYGDDFRFVKKKRLNLIVSEHAQKWIMNASPSHYYSYDVDEAKKKFISFNNEYFKSVFFDFAPILAVPAYIEEPCAALEPLEEYDANFTYYEHEVMANAIGYEHFVHEESSTEAILKTKLSRKQTDADEVAVTAYSYATAERVDLIPVFGGDGRFHDVPVPWVEYLPRERTTLMHVSPADGTDKEGKCFHGMVARAME